MRSAVSDALRKDAQAEVLALTPAERYALAHQLGQQDVQRHAAFHGVTVEEARHRLRAGRQAGRRRSCAQRLG